MRLQLLSLGAATAAALAAPAAGVQNVSASLLPSGHGVDPMPRYSHVIIDAPCQVDGGRFGESAVFLDFDGDSLADVGVGANGVGAAYVLLGTGDPLDPFTTSSAFNCNGAVGCPPPQHEDNFGSAIAAGRLDDDADEELVVGASGFQFDVGAVFVIGLQDQLVPLRLYQAEPEVSRLGHSVAVGDLNHDGFMDVAAGAPQGKVGGVVAGNVFVYYGPFDRSDGVVTPDLVLENPLPVVNGNFGHVVVVDDHNGDGVDDLFVSAVGNTSQAGLSLAGQIFYFEGPVSQANYFAVEDPTPNPADLPTPRFGMNIDARAGMLAVGSPRKDHGTVHDTGRSFLFRDVGFNVVTEHLHPRPRMNDINGFRVRIVQALGAGDALDLLAVTLPSTSVPTPNPLALLLWDGGTAAPVGRMLEAAPNAQDHFSNGLDVGDIFGAAGDEIITGDPTYNRPPDFFQLGRLVLYYAH